MSDALTRIEEIRNAVLKSEHVDRDWLLEVLDSPLFKKPTEEEIAAAEPPTLEQFIEGVKKNWIDTWPVYWQKFARSAVERYEALVKAHDEKVTIAREFQKLFVEIRPQFESLEKKIAAVCADRDAANRVADSVSQENLALREHLDRALKALKDAQAMLLASTNTPPASDSRWTRIADALDPENKEGR
jgi:hypothetical protein